MAAKDIQRDACNKIWISPHFSNFHTYLTCHQSSLMTMQSCLGLIESKYKNSQGLLRDCDNTCICYINAI
jgi:hypothetical protein